MEKLYRYCCRDEVKNFVTNGFLRSRNCDYVSITDNQKTTVFDINDPKYNYCITFNADRVYAQGGFKVEYTEEFFKQNPIILQHVSGWKLENEEYKPTYLSLEHLIHSCIHNTNHEQEVLVKFLTFEKDLILSIDRWDGIDWVNVIENKTLNSD